MSDITHYDGCWHDPKHHACAVREIEQHQIWLSEMVEDFRLDADAYDLSRRRAIAEALRNARVEIERLREENALLTKGWQPATPTALRDEIERLREELLTRHAEARKQAEEIERLRSERDVPLDRVAYEEGRAQGRKEADARGDSPRGTE